MPFILRKTITETFLERVRETPDLVGFQFKSENAWREITFRQFHDECRLASFGLMGLGVGPADKVANRQNVLRAFRVSHHDATRIVLLGSQQILD